MNIFTRNWLNFLLLSGLSVSVVNCDKKYDGDQEPDPTPDPNEINFEIVNGTVTDIDGNTYETVNIAGQEWMTENLKTTRYRDGSDIEFPGTDNSLWVAGSTGAYAWYQDDETNGIYCILKNHHF